MAISSAPFPEKKRRGTKKANQLKEGTKVTKDTSSQVSVKYNNVNKYIKSDQATWQAGQLTYYENSWKQITSDPWIIETIMGVNIELTS